MHMHRKYMTYENSPAFWRRHGEFHEYTGTIIKFLIENNWITECEQDYYSINDCLILEYYKDLV
jgi:hypothetical protein